MNISLNYYQFTISNASALTVPVYKVRGLKFLLLLWLLITVVYERRKITELYRGNC
jgi:hypothetical protein